MNTYKKQAGGYRRRAMLSGNPKLKYNGKSYVCASDRGNNKATQCFETPYLYEYGMSMECEISHIYNGGNYVEQNGQTVGWNEPRIMGVEGVQVGHNHFFLKFYWHRFMGESNIGGRFRECGFGPYVENDPTHHTVKIGANGEIIADGVFGEIFWLETDPYSHTDNIFCLKASPAHLYRFRIWAKSGAVIADYIPAEYEGTGALYNRVDGTYLLPTGGTVDFFEE